MSGNPGQPQQNPQELFDQAVRELEPVIPGLGKGIQESFRQFGSLSPQLSDFLSRKAEASATETRNRIAYILYYSAQAASQPPSQMSQVQSHAPNKKETGRFPQILPLPGQAAPVSQGTPTHPSPSPENNVPMSLIKAPEELRKSFETFLQQPQNRQRFIDELLAPALAHKYNGLTFIAQGGMGMIVKAYDPKLDRFVALKLNTLALDPLLLQNFLNEGKKAARIEHPNVITVYETGEAIIPYGNRQLLFPYHALEFIHDAQDGNFLLKEPKKYGKTLPTDPVLHLIRQYVSGIAAAHKKDTVHRDIKPDNVMVPSEIQVLLRQWIQQPNDQSFLEGLKGNRKELKVADFGLASLKKNQNQTAQQTTEVAHAEQSLTGQGGIVGTPYYIPPEGYLDPNSAGKPWDVYSLGLVFYMMLTGHENPLQYSKGFDFEAARLTGITYYISKIGAMPGPAIASPEQDPYLKRLLDQDPNNARIITMLQRMTAENPADRPDIDECLTWLDEELKFRSPEKKKLNVAETKLKKVGRKVVVEQQKTKKAQKKAAVATTGKKKAWGAAGLAFAALTALGLSAPFVLKSKGRDDFLKAHTQTMNNADGLISSRNWTDAIALLNEEKEKVQLNKYLEDTEKANQLTELVGHIEYARTMQRLDQVDSELTNLHQNAERAMESTRPEGVSRTFPGISGNPEVVTLVDGQKCIAPLQGLYVALLAQKTFLASDECSIPDDEKALAQARLATLEQELAEMEVLLARPVAVYSFRAGDTLAVELYGIIFQRSTDARVKADAQAQLRKIQEGQEHFEDLRNRLAGDFPQNPAQRADELARERRRILLALAPLLRGRQVDQQLSQNVAQVLRFMEEGYYETNDIPGDSSWKTDAVALFSQINPEARARFQTLVDDFDRWFRDFTNFRQQVGAQARTPQAMPSRTPHEEAMDHMAGTWISLERLHSNMGERPLPVHDFISLFSDPRWAAMQDSHEIVKWFIQHYGGIGHFLDQLKAHPGHARGMQHFLATAVLIFEQTERAVAEGNIPALGPRQKSNFYTTMLHDLSLLYRVREITGDYLTETESASTWVSGDYLASPIFYQRMQEACMAAPNKAEKLNIISQFHFILTHSGQNPSRETRFLSLIREVGLTPSDLQQAGIDMR